MDSLLSLALPKKEELEKTYSRGLRLRVLWLFRHLTANVWFCVEKGNGIPLLSSRSQTQALSSRDLPSRGLLPVLVFFKCFFPLSLRALALPSP